MVSYSNSYCDDDTWEVIYTTGWTSDMVFTLIFMEERYEYNKKEGFGKADNCFGYYADRVYREES